MIKEAKNVDFYTTGRQPSEQDFERISEWIRQKKEKVNKAKKSSGAKKKHLAQQQCLQDVGRRYAAQEQFFNETLYL